MNSSEAFTRSTLFLLCRCLFLSKIIQLTGLTPSTTYHYKTLSKDKAGNLAKSTKYTFTTLEEAPVPVPTPEPTSPDMIITPLVEEAMTPPPEVTPHPASETISAIRFSTIDFVLIGIGSILTLGLIIEIIIRRRREFATKSLPTAGVGARSP